jgi:hypothetical protein
MEHRWGARLKAEIPVLLKTRGGVIGAGCIKDFSVSGAFIATTLPIAVLSQVNVTFRSGRRNTHSTGSSTFEAQVVRRTPDGFAVEWCEFATHDAIAFAAAKRVKLLRRSERTAPRSCPAGVERPRHVANVSLSHGSRDGTSDVTQPGSGSRYRV